MLTPLISSLSYHIVRYFRLSDNLTMTEWLYNLAELSNLVSFLFVLVTFMFMLVYLIRLIGEDLGNGQGNVNVVSHTPPRVNLSKIVLPFHLSFTCATPDYRVELSLTSLVPGRLRVFWGVDISAFHQVLRAPEAWFVSVFNQGNLFGRCRHSGEIQSVAAAEDGCLVFTPPSQILPLKLGKAPREEFPLVVVILNEDSSSLVTAIHIQDAECPVPSQILSRHFRQQDRVTELRSLFVAASDAGENSDTESQEESDTEDLTLGGGKRKSFAASRCIICQEERISRAILPCRHAATCGGCFTRLQNRCPMCRGFIQTYFLIRQEPVQMDQEDGQDASSNEQPARNSWTDRLAAGMAWFRGALPQRMED